jgi:hypothetical protein
MINILIGLILCALGGLMVDRVVAIIKGTDRGSSHR